MNTEENFDIALKFISDLQRKIGGDKLIYRGIPEGYDSNRILSSSIYRNAQKGSDNIFNKYFSPTDIEKEIVGRAKRFFKHGTGKIEILTELRHFGGDASLIDFSRNLMVALFFSCNGEPKKDGWLITCSEDQFQNFEEVYYQKMPKDPFVIEPAITDRSQARTLIQSSVFLYVPEGYIGKKLYKRFKIPHDKRGLILDYLRVIHNISEETIYNDLPGFLSNEKSFKTASLAFYRGLAKCNSGEYPEAVDEFSDAISHRPDFSEAICNRGVAKSRDGDLEGAVEDYDRATQINPNYAETYYNRGVAKGKNGDHAGAREDYDRAIQIDPDYASAYYNRGNAKSRCEDYAGAMADYDRAIQIDPDYADAYYNRGVAKSECGDNAGAIKDYSRVIQINSDYADAYCCRGVAKKECGDHTGAMEDFGRAIQIDPNYADAYCNRGLAKSKNGDHAEAIEDCNKAIQIDPDYANAYHNRGLARKALGQGEAAEEDFRKAEELRKQQADNSGT